MIRDTRSPSEVSVGPGWRCHVDQRTVRPGEHAICGVDGQYRGETFNVMVTAVLCKGCAPRGAVIAALEEALEKARGGK